MKNTGYFFVGVFVFVIIAIAIMLTIYIPSALDLISDRAEAEVKDAVFANAAASEAYFSRKISFLEAAASEFTKIDTEDDAAVEDTCAAISINSRLGNTFRHIGFTRMDGMTISSIGKTANTSNRLFIQAGLNGDTTVSAHSNCDFDGAVSDMYTVPVKDLDGKLIGALTGDSTPFVFTDITMLDIAGDLNCFFIFDDSGDVVYCSTDSKLGIGTSDNLTSLISDNLMSKDIGYLLNSTSRNTFKRFTIGGTEYAASFMSICGNGWTFAAVIPADDVYTSFGSLIGFTITLIILMSALLLVSIIIVTVRINRVTIDFDEALDSGLKRIYTDSITGHDTIERFREYYAVAMKDTATGHALISLDVDRFKAVNDMFGYEGGNEVIRKLSDIIKRNIGKNDFFARSSGDLFYIFAEFSDKEELSDLANGIMSDVEYQITEVKLNLAIGIYIVDDPHLRSRVAADRADMARESVKNSKESRFGIFDSSMLEKIRREKKIEDIMEDSLALGEFLVYLQPKVSLGLSNDVVGAEALVRWRHDGKLIPPGDFIPLFERNGFVTKIDYYMFEEVCKLQKKYVSLGYKPKIVSVNMSRLHIHKPGFVAELASMCDKYSIDTKYIEIEITESAAYEDMAVLNEIFREIKSYGFHVSIDDFGTGYSSLNMLKDLPVDVIKIDRSFLTEDADETENASLIIACVVSLAAGLGISTICEGIETVEQANLLTKLGCDMAQGFYFAKPMPVENYEELAYNIKQKN